MWNASIQFPFVLIRYQCLYLDPTYSCEKKLLEVNNGPSLGISKNKKSFQLQGLCPSDSPNRGCAPGPCWGLYPRPPIVTPAPNLPLHHWCARTVDPYVRVTCNRAFSIVFDLGSIRLLIGSLNTALVKQLSDRPVHNKLEMRRPCFPMTRDRSRSLLFATMMIGFECATS